MIASRPGLFNMRRRPCVETTLLLVLSLCLWPPRAGAQWVQAGVPGSFPVNVLAVFGRDVFAGTKGGGIFRSADNGVSWRPNNTGLPAKADVRCFAEAGGALFAGTYEHGVFRSTDNGATWEPRNAGLPAVADVWDLKAAGPKLFAATWRGLFVSSDGGASWMKSSAGLPETDIWSVAMCGTALYAGTGDGVFRSADGGADWKPANAGLPNTDAGSLTVFGKILFAIAVTGRTTTDLYVSTNEGVLWTSRNPRLSETASVASLAASRTRLFAGTSEGVFFSTDGGKTWMELGSGLLDTDIVALAVGDTDLFAATRDMGIWRLPLAGIAAPDRRPEH